MHEEELRFARMTASHVSGPADWLSVSNQYEPPGHSIVGRYLGTKVPKYHLCLEPSTDLTVWGTKKHCLLLNFLKIAQVFSVIPAKTNFPLLALYDFKTSMPNTLQCLYTSD